MSRICPYHNSLFLNLFSLTTIFITVGFTSFCSSSSNVMHATYGRIPVGTLLALYDTISVTSVRSKEECLMRCLTQQNCRTVILEENTAGFYCDMKSNVSSSYLAMTSGTVAYALLWKSSNNVGQGQGAITSSNQLAVMTTTMLLTSQASLLQTSVAPVSSSIVDLVQGVFTNMCTVSSQTDFLVVTHQGLYFYDDYYSLSVGPCLYEPDITKVFNGFSNLPDVTQWEAVMAFQNSWVDVYTGSNVYRWQHSGTGIQKIGVYPKVKKAHIGFITSTSVSTVPSVLVWAVHRKDTGGHLVYYYDGTQFYLYNNQNPKERIFQQSDNDVIDNNSRDLNIFKTIHSNVVGLTTTDNSGGEFVYVTSPDMQHYRLDNSGNIYSLGELKLS